MLLLLAAPALADKNEARALMHQGLAAYEAQDWAGALTAFLASYQASPSYEVLQNIGLCQKQLGQFNDAVASLEAYLKQGGKKLPLDRRAKVVEQLQEIRAFTAAVDVLAAGDAAEVFIDGVRVGQTPLARLLLAPGTRRFTLTRPGFQTWERHYALVSGSDVAVSATLEPLRVEPAPVAVAPVSAPLVPAPGPVTKTEAPPERDFPVFGIVGMATGVLLNAGAIPIAVDSNNAYREIAAVYETGGTWDSAKATRQSWGKTGRTISVVTFATGGALLLAGTLGTIFSLALPANPAPSARLLVAPLPGGGLVSLQGTF